MGAGNDGPGADSALVCPRLAHARRISGLFPLDTHRRPGAHHLGKSTTGVFCKNRIVRRDAGGVRLYAVCATRPILERFPSPRTAVVVFGVRVRAIPESGAPASFAAINRIACAIHVHPSFLAGISLLRPRAKGPPIPALHLRTGRCRVDIDHPADGPGTAMVVLARW